MYFKGKRVKKTHIATNTNQYFTVTVSQILYFVYIPWNQNWFECHQDRAVNVTLPGRQIIFGHVSHYPESVPDKRLQVKVQTGQSSLHPHQ